MTHFKWGLLALAAVSMACSKEGPTGPDIPTSPPVAQATPAPVAANPQPVAPAESPAPDKPSAYVTFSQTKDGSGTFCNPTQAPRLVILFYTAPGVEPRLTDPQWSTTAQPGQCVDIPPVPDALELRCGTPWDFQIDAKLGSIAGAHLGAVFSKGKTQSCTCEDFERPSVEASASIAVQYADPKTVAFLTPSASPAGGSWDPTVPAEVELGSQPQKLYFNYSGSVPYGPEGLECSVRYSVNVCVDLDKACTPTAKWTVTNKREDHKDYTIVVATSQQDPENTGVPGSPFVLGPDESATFFGFENQTLYAFFRFTSQPQTVYWYDGGSGIQNDCTSEGGTYHSSIDGRSHVCATPQNHGTWWEYDNNDWAQRYKTTEIPGGFTYDFADSATGDCGRVGPLWVRDAKLEVECVCREEQPD